MERTPARAPVVMLHTSHDANRRPATGVPPNERFAPLVERQLAACRRYGAGLAVLSISLDGLRTVRERHGATLEERVLDAAWQRLKSRLRASDTVARVGPDSFGAILMNAAVSGAASVEARLFDELSAPYRIGSLVVEIMAYTGVAVYVNTGMTAEELVQAASDARLAKGG